MHCQEEFKQFFKELLNSLPRRINVVLFGFFLILQPPQNAYSNWEIPLGEPVVREISISIPEPEEYPVNVNQVAAPWLSAKSVIVVDVDSKGVLLAKNPDWQLFPASTTKMMTALVVLEQYQLTDTITVSDLNGSIGQTMELEIGEQLTVESLLYGLLVQSGNDVAVVLAQNYPGGSEAFVERMNQKAEELHLNQTRFKNPSGVEAFEHVSTVHDLAILGAEVIKNPILARIVSTPKITVTDLSGEIEHDLTNINQLVGQVPGVLGVKTGWTENAGECLVTYVERNGRRIMIALLGSEDRFGETETLINWIFENHKWEQIQNPT